MTHDYCMILTTAGSQAEAESLAEKLVSSHMAACVQMTQIASCYVWEGKINKESETLLLIKTTAQLYSEVESAILDNHSYEVPEIIQIPVVQGLAQYLGWIDENTKHK